MRRIRVTLVSHILTKVARENRESWERSEDRREEKNPSEDERRGELGITRGVKILVY